MKLIATDHDFFPEINNFNPRLKKGSRRLKLTIDTISPRALYLERFPSLLFSILDLFPNIKRHRCGHSQVHENFRDYDTSHLLAPIKIMGDVIDTVHLLEHVTLELQCQIGGMDVCSGLTCNYWEPENRFDVFVECEEPALGLFSCNFAMDVLQKLIYGPEESIEVDDPIALARSLYENQGCSIAEVQHNLAWPEERVARNLARLEALKFPREIIRNAA